MRQSNYRAGWGTNHSLTSRFHRLTCFLVLLLFAGALTAGAPSATRAWLGADGQELPFTTDAEILDFLRTAEVVSKERVGSGVNNPWKVLLERDGIRAHAVFRNVCLEKDKVRLKDGLKFNFRDDAIFEVAAYRLGLLLGLTNIPPVVDRSLFGEKGTLQLWLEKAMTEGDRLDRELRPQDMNRVQRWQIQTHIMRAFDCLIYNEDRNHGNLLYDSNWNLWMIDHTRAFRRYRKLPNPESVWRIEKNFLERLRQLDPEEVKATLKGYLKPAEVRGVLERVQGLLRHAETLIESKGAELILVELPPLKDPHLRPLAALLGN